MKKAISAYIDRIEENIAVIYLGDEEEHKINIPIKFLPKDIKENTKLKIAISIDTKNNIDTEKEVEDLRKMLIDGS
jgi:hypothetical protein